MKVTSVQRKTLLWQEIAALLKTKAIEPAPPGPGFCSLMFVIPKRNGGYRPIFNLKGLNQFLDAPRFKMETLQQVVHLICPNDWVTSCDLLDAYLHLLLSHHTRKYFQFRFDGQVFQFRTGGFGLSVMPYLFNKLCRPIRTWARRQGIRVTAYLDDWLILGSTQAKAQRNTDLVLAKLRELG